jgi:hypothetical protein
LPARLEAEPGPNEHSEIRALLAKIETALKLFGPPDRAAAGEKDSPVRSNLGRRKLLPRRACHPDEYETRSFPNEFPDRPDELFRMEGLFTMRLPGTGAARPAKSRWRR